MEPDKPIEEPAPKPAPQPAASTTGMWAVQLGSFSNKENAERLAAAAREVANSQGRLATHVWRSAASGRPMSTTPFTDSARVQDDQIVGDGGDVHRNGWRRRRRSAAVRA